MQDATTTSQLISTIIAAVLVLLFFGFLFLVMLMYYNNKKRQVAKEKQMMKETFEKQLLQSRLEIQNQTFNSISQEIHDNVGQTLSLAKVQANIMEQRGAFDGDLLRGVKESISNALSDLRDIAKSLSSERIQLTRLPELIGTELQRIKRTGLMEAILNMEGMEKMIDNQKKLILFRIVQESLQNILKHAKAGEVVVTLRYGESQLDILIRDNGVGFDTLETTQKGQGLGLYHLVGRAALIGGRASITSVIGEGTCIHIGLPEEGQATQHS